MGSEISTGVCIPCPLFPVAADVAGIVPMAHSTDSSGSIRVSAAMSIGHALSRTVRDSAFLLDQTACYEPGALAAAPGPGRGYFEVTQAEPKPLRIALNLSEPGVKIDSQVRKAVRKTARLLESQGHVIEEAAPEIDFEELNHAQNALVLSQFAQGIASLATALGKTVETMGLEPLSQEFVHAGLAFSASEFISACHVAYATGASMVRFQQQYDIVLQAMTTTPPPELGVINAQPGDTVYGFVNRFKEHSGYTHLFNLTGQPTAPVPMGFSTGGLPLATMLSARNGEDALLFGACAQLERAAPWFDRRPLL